MRISAILLASGLSRRFGENKLIYPFKGQALYQYSFDLVDAFDWEEIVVVTATQEILEEGRRRNYSSIYNGQAKEGKAASIRLALNHSQPTDAFIFFVCDQPFFKKESLKKMRDLLFERQSIVYPCYQGRPGNPVAFPSSYKEALLGLKGEEGGSLLLKSAPGISFEVEEARELFDIDKKSDIRKGK